MGKLSPTLPPSRLQRIIGDGNCFFRAVSYWVTGSQDQHIQLRDLVLRHLQGEIKLEMQVYLGQDPGEYVDNSGLRNNGVWATDVEIKAAASLLGVDILVYARYGSTLQWQVFPASLHLTQLSEQAIFLDNSSGKHFDVVVSCRQ